MCVYQKSYSFINILNIEILFYYKVIFSRTYFSLEIWTREQPTWKKKPKSHLFCVLFHFFLLLNSSCNFFFTYFLPKESEKANENKIKKSLFRFVRKNTERKNYTLTKCIIQSVYTIANYKRWKCFDWRWFWNHIILCIRLDCQLTGWLIG